LYLDKMKALVGSRSKSPLYEDGALYHLMTHKIDSQSPSSQI
jgi:hypothetical protein